MQSSPLQTTMLPAKSKAACAAPKHTFAVAPMLNWTDKHCRYFHRLLTSRALLYTEMVTTNALLHGSNTHVLSLNAADKPVAFQLGGNHPQALARCAQMIERAGYDEVNLNLGCPSDRVQNARFGACLMAEPELVAACVAAMRQAVSIPVTVKSRIGIDERDSYPELLSFITTVADAGCNSFAIHARKAWLQGLSPKQNRLLPPLCYDFVYQLKRDLPSLHITLNGGVTDLDNAQTILQRVDGVMMGREAYHNPYLLATVDNRFYAAATTPKTRHQVVLDLLPYIETQLEAGGNLHAITRHILGLFHGLAGAKKWRRLLSENGSKKGADAGVILDALPPS